MHKNKNIFDTTTLSYGEQILWPDHCIAGSKGAEFHPLLNTTKANAIIRKGYNPNIRNCEDYDLVARIIKKFGHGLYLPFPYYKYYKTNMTHLTNLKSRSKSFGKEHFCEPI